MTSEPTTFLFSGYARLSQDVSHQAMYKRVGVVLEVDEAGVVVACSTTLMMTSADDFFWRLLVGRPVERRPSRAARVGRAASCGHGRAAAPAGRQRRRPGLGRVSLARGIYGE